MNQKRILLLEPPFYRLFKDTYALTQYPLALGYLAGAVRKNTNWDVTAYHCDFLPQSEGMTNSYFAGPGFRNYLDRLSDLSAPIWQEIRSTIAECAPAVLGISTKSQNFASACNVARLAKEISDQIIVVVGGPHPSMVGAEVLECPDIDVCVSGEGETTVVELLDAIGSGKEFADISGIIYRDENRIVENPPRKFIEDLDSLWFPHETAPDVLKDYHKYPPTAFNSVFATRGCPYNCIFCGSREIWSRKVRFRSPENVIREIKGLQEKGLESIHFHDDTFGVKKQYIAELCNLLMKECPGLKWSCEFHVKLVNDETISLMKAAGCDTIQVGIESGNNEILKQNRKNITIEEALAACEIIKKHGIRLYTFFMVGFPQETERTLRDTMAAMKKVKDIGCEYIVYSIFTPYPGTESFELCRENGLIGKDYDVSLYNHQSPANCFCVNITPERFRELACEVEEMVDRVNSQ